MIDNQIDLPKNTSCIANKAIPTNKPTVFCATTSEVSMEQTIRVDIFIAEHCFVCEYSQEVAAFIRERFPQVQINMIDMADPTADIPDSVFATPTYLLNGRLWSLGNPSNEDVVDKLSSMLAEM